MERVADPVGFWLGRLAPGCKSSYSATLNGFLRWLQARPSWAKVDVRGLLFRQAEAKDPFELVELLEEYVCGREIRSNSKRYIVNVVRSFFLHNRVALPSDRGFKPRSEVPPVRANLTLETVAALVKGADMRDRSLFLVKWQAMLDNERLLWVGRSLADSVVKQMREQVHPVRLDIPSRKQNQAGFYTYIGKDAVEALRLYFENERGWPKPGEPIWPKKTWKGEIQKIQKGKSKLTHKPVQRRLLEPLTRAAFNKLWIRQLRRIGIIPKKAGGTITTRYGYNPHEMRDVAKSLLHTQAKKDGFDMDCAEFWLGHTVDPLGYDKFMLDQEYVRKQYLIAEKYLNIISTPTTRETEEKYEEKLMAMNAKLARVEEILKQLGAQEVVKPLNPEA